MFPTWSYGDSTSRCSRGVVIGFNRNTVFVVKELLADPEGGFLFIKGKLFTMDSTIASIYCPNRKPERFLRKNIKKLMVFKEVKLIVAGVFNMCIDPRVDARGGAPH